MKQTLYCDIDSLLDTRLGTIMKLDEKQGKLLANDKRYYSRVHDDLSVLVEGISSEQYLEAYKNRNIETMMKSRPTNMLVNLTTIFLKLTNDKINTPYVETIQLDLNIFPYRMSDFTEEELTDLKDILSFYTSADTIINCIDLDPKLLTPNYIKDTYGAVIMYDFTYWLDYAFPKMQSSVRLPAITFMAPALYADKDKIPTEEDETIDDKRVNAFAATEFMLIEYLSLAFQPPIAFSLVTPENFMKQKPDANKTTSESSDDVPA